MQQARVHQVVVISLHDGHVPVAGENRGTPVVAPVGATGAGGSTLVSDDLQKG